MDITVDEVPTLVHLCLIVATTRQPNAPKMHHMHMHMHMVAHTCTCTCIHVHAHVHVHVCMCIMCMCACTCPSCNRGKHTPSQMHHAQIRTHTITHGYTKRHSTRHSTQMADKWRMRYGRALTRGAMCKLRHSNTTPQLC